MLFDININPTSNSIDGGGNNVPLKNIQPDSRIMYSGVNNVAEVNYQTRRRFRLVGMDVDVRR
jgi:hypothetical protein